MTDRKKNELTIRLSWGNFCRMVLEWDEMRAIAEATNELLILRCITSYIIQSNDRFPSSNLFLPQLLVVHRSTKTVSPYHHNR